MQLSLNISKGLLNFVKCACRTKSQVRGVHHVETVVQPNSVPDGPQRYLSTRSSIHALRWDLKDERSHLCSSPLYAAFRCFHVLMRNAPADWETTSSTDSCLPAPPRRASSITKIAGSPSGRKLTALQRTHGLNCISVTRTLIKCSHFFHHLHGSVNSKEHLDVVLGIASTPTLTVIKFVDPEHGDPLGGHGTVTCMSTSRCNADFTRRSRRDVGYVVAC